MKDAIQEQLITMRKKQILDAAAKVFAENGYHPTTIKDIARAAGVADGTIYIYFENKMALLLGILDLMGQTLRQESDLSQPTGTDFRQFMRAYFSLPLMAFKADNFALFKVIISEIIVNQELKARYYEQILEPSIVMAEQYFQQWADQQPGRKVDISLLVRATSSLIMGLMVQYVMGDPVLQTRWGELPDFLTDMLLNGIASNQ
jgi:TetR/AcrR family fatty acid metabolism transcriptional regulator